MAATGAGATSPSGHGQMLTDWTTSAALCKAHQRQRFETRSGMEATASPDDTPFFHDGNLMVCCNNRAGRLKPGFRRRRLDRKNLHNNMKAQIEGFGLKRDRVNMAGCLDRCEVGLRLEVYPPSILHKETSSADVEVNLGRHVRDGGRGAELLLPAAQQGSVKELLARVCFGFVINSGKQVVDRP